MYKAIKALFALSGYIRRREFCIRLFLPFPTMYAEDIFYARCRVNKYVIRNLLPVSRSDSHVLSHCMYEGVVVHVRVCEGISGQV